MEREPPSGYLFETTQNMRQEFLNQIDARHDKKSATAQADDFVTKAQQIIHDIDNDTLLV